MEPSKKRLFVGVEVAPEIRAAIQEAVGLLARQKYSCRWVPPENIHLTLRFLGDCPAEQIEAILGALETAASQVPPFSLATDRFGSFPSARRARVLWLGLTDTVEIQKLYEKISAQLEGIGFPREQRAFRPHITFARLKRPAAVDLTATEHISTGRPLQIDKVTLFSSRLSQSGAIYEVVGRAGLGRKKA